MVSKPHFHLSLSLRIARYATGDLNSTDANLAPKISTKNTIDSYNVYKVDLNEVDFYIPFCFATKYGNLPVNPF